MFEGLLSGKTAFVTGASSGLGWRMAKCLARAGASVAITARRRERLAELEAEINQAGGKAAAISLNVRDLSDIERAVSEASEVLGPIDILVNNAGVSEVKRAEDFTQEDYRFVMETNLDGPWYCAQTVGRQMIQRGEGGKIINISSMLGMRTMNQLAPYCISKAAVIQMTECLALEWARHDIQVNAICPGYIETEMNGPFWRTKAGEALIAKFPNRKVGDPDDLDGLLLLLSSPLSGFINGAIIPIDDAQRFM